MVIVAKQRRMACAVIGDEMIGKSCFIKSFLGEEFSEKYVATTSEVYNGHAVVGGERFNIEIADIANEVGFDKYTYFIIRSHYNMHYFDKLTSINCISKCQMLNTILL